MNRRTIAGRYRLVERLGAGGMGVVYRALDATLRREVAVKLLPASTLGDEAARRRLLHEARAAAAIEHPGIVPVFDAGETEQGEANPTGASVTTDHRKPWTAELLIHRRPLEPGEELPELDYGWPVLNAFAASPQTECP